MGYDPSKCEFIDLNRPYGPECKYHLLRGVAASFSTLTMPIMFYCARNFGASVKFAFLASMLVCFDMLNLGEGRLILMDSQLIFWLMATLLIGQEWWRRLNAHELWLAINNKAGGAATSVVSSFSSALRPLPAHQRLTLVQRYLWAVAVGICCGNAINVKMTGLVTPAMIALESFWGIWFLLKPIGFLELLITLGSAILTYSAWFGVSFWLFVNSGPNKVEQEFMTPLFQATLVNSDNYDPTGNALREWRAKEGFWWTMITHNARMIKHNANILAPHPWQTTWYEWVLNLRGVAYYGKDEAHRYHTQVYLLGNPAVIWSVLAAIVLSVVTLIVYVRYRASFSAGAGVHSFAKHATFCLLAYLLNLLPYFGVARSTFIYHYSKSYTAPLRHQCHRQFNDRISFSYLFFLLPFCSARARVRPDRHCSFPRDTLAYSLALWSYQALYAWYSCNVPLPFGVALCLPDLARGPRPKEVVTQVELRSSEE
jgi:dolichyl-phosphate-mannose--protein O-mannosyl transferase